VTDEDGQFAFDHVEAGWHGLGYGERRHSQVVVEPGRATRVDALEWIDEVALDVRTSLDTGTEKISGVLLGPEPVSTIREFRVREGRIVVGHALPGRYLLMSMRGPIAPFEFRPAGGAVDLGDARLVVRAEPVGIRDTEIACEVEVTAPRTEIDLR